MLFNFFYKWVKKIKKNRFLWVFVFYIVYGFFYLLLVLANVRLVLVVKQKHNVTALVKLVEVFRGGFARRIVARKSAFHARTLQKFLTRLRPLRRLPHTPTRGLRLVGILLRVPINRHIIAKARRAPALRVLGLELRGIFLKLEKEVPHLPEKNSRILGVLGLESLDELGIETLANELAHAAHAVNITRKPRQSIVRPLVPRVADRHSALHKKIDCASNFPVARHFVLFILQ